MSGVAIVAIPNKNDRVWSVSSEKVPHMTLLYLGDALDEKDYQQVFEWIEHVANTTLTVFGMSVGKRDELGEDKADVVFLKDIHDSRISQFRTYLLQNPIIREAYESIEQYDGWLPHVTLGYPETPAKKVDPEVSELYWIGFNKIALWVGDYEGPEVELNDNDYALAMSNGAQTDAFLAHYGVKGMRWGVRKALDNRAADKAWAKAALNEKNAKKHIDVAFPKIYKDLGPIEKKYASVFNGTATRKEIRDYNNESISLVQRRLQETAHEVYGRSPSGRKEIQAYMNVRGNVVVRVTPTRGSKTSTDVTHAETDESSSIEFAIIRDSVGRITELRIFSIDGGSMEQTLIEEVEDFLAHYGVKGMRWGVRKDRSGNAYGSVHKGVRAGHRRGGNPRASGIDKLSNAYNQTIIGKVTNTLTRVLTSGPFTAAQTAAVIGLAATGPAGVTLGSAAVIAANAAATQGLVAAWSNKDNVYRINRKKEYNGVNLKKNPELRKKYHKEQMDSFGRALLDPAGLRFAETQMRVQGKAGDNSIVVKPKDLYHSTETTDLTIDLIYNDLGHIVEFKPRVSKELERAFYDIVEGNDSGELEQSALAEVTTNNFLSHYGVKGMRWGVRKSREERRAERTARVEAKNQKAIAKSEQYIARANAKKAAADAKTAEANARRDAANARLATKQARLDAKDARVAARKGPEGIVGETRRESKELRKEAAKNARTLDDATLRDFTQRLDTEKKLKNAVKEDVNPGRSAAKKLISDAGKDVAKKALVGVGSMAVFYAVNRKVEGKPLIDNRALGNLLTGKKGASADAVFIPNSSFKGNVSKSDRDKITKNLAELAKKTKVPAAKIPPPF